MQLLFSPSVFCFLLHLPYISSSFFFLNRIYALKGRRVGPRHIHIQRHHTQMWHLYTLKHWELPANLTNMCYCPGFMSLMKNCKCKINVCWWCPVLWVCACGWWTKCIEHFNVTFHSMLKHVRRNVDVCDWVPIISVSLSLVDAHDITGWRLQH